MSDDSSHIEETYIKAPNKNKLSSNKFINPSKNNNKNINHLKTQSNNIAIGISKTPEPRMENPETFSANLNGNMRIYF